MSMLEVAHPAMHESRGPARCPARKVPRLNQGDAEPSKRGVSRDSRARNPAPDNDDIEGFERQSSPSLRSPCRGLSHVSLPSDQLSFHP